MRRRRFLAGSVGTAIGLAGCVGGGTQVEYDIGMTASSFRPAEFEVAVGESVRWLNTNSRAHTVTAYQDGIPDGADYFATGGFDTESAARDAYDNRLGGSLYSEAVFEHTFDVAGEYQYFCVPHELGGMVGTIAVRE